MNGNQEMHARVFNDLEKQREELRGMFVRFFKKLLAQSNKKVLFFSVIIALLFFEKIVILYSVFGALIVLEMIKGVLILLNISSLKKDRPDEK